MQSAQHNLWRVDGQRRDRLHRVPVAPRQPLDNPGLADSLDGAARAVLEILVDMPGVQDLTNRSSTVPVRKRAPKQRRLELCHPQHFLLHGLRSHVLADLLAEAFGIYAILSISSEASPSASMPSTTSLPTAAASPPSPTEPSLKSASPSASSASLSSAPTSRASPSAAQRRQALQLFLRHRSHARLVPRQALNLAICSFLADKCRKQKTNPPTSSSYGSRAAWSLD